MLSILLSGAGGRVGGEIRQLVDADPGLQIVGIAGRERWFAGETDADVLIDFSRPDSTARCVEFALQQRLPLVIGTTGLPPELQQGIDAAAERIPICQAANFSIGVNFLLELVERAAAGLPDSFDIEISEIHHRWKVDAPSGTALALGRAAAAARGQDHDRVASIRSDGARAAGQIGYQVSRGGDVIGEHSVMFLGEGERLELTHRASDRAIFARGALHAARWLLDRPPGLYSMRDVLRA
ncbi:MAG: 4-hydroxy-tetrahydrodipicolinate reductase [Gammaproteobacteria bacterium HGW-Gammaproteobacteria-8]|nr:MAG: 4-hydroxy-tetrahydrodipicolinate reductase [Gammaproteobacteria bacterium HGW-Gammaproteobacteria-8]